MAWLRLTDLEPSYQLEEENLMSILSLETALDITRHALVASRELSTAPLTIAVLDAGGHLLSLQREDGASMLRPQIAIGKAWGAVALGKSSRVLAADAQQRPSFIAAVNTLAQGNVVPAPGGVLIRNSANEVIGAIGISGDASDIDEQCAIRGVQALGLVADAG
jgi:uncharacterized protein GlcG (DUF336 family)